MASGILLPKIAVIAALAGGLSVILIIGLVSGLVGRPNNCIPLSTTPSTTTTASTTTTSTTTTSTTTTTTSTTTSSTTTTRTLPSTTTTRTSSSTTTTRTSSSTTTTRTSSSTTTTRTSPLTTTTRTLPTTTLRTTPEITENEELFRLPKFIQPKLYKLLIKTDFDPYGTRQSVNGSKNQWTRYFGEVELTLDIQKETNRIDVHVNIGINIEMERTVLTQTSNNQTVTLERQNYLPNDLFEFVTQNTIQPGEYTLKIYFNAITSFIGFYKADYLENETQRSLLATRFSPNLARTAFPCFDEPGFKAEYDLTIEHPERSLAFSNFESSNIESFEEGGVQKQRTTFFRTFKMSANLLAWAIVPDDFQLKSMTVDNVEIRVHGRKSAIDNNLAEYPLQVAKDVLNYYKVNLGVEEAIPPKINLIGLPGYPQKSSPSWGLNAFHEDYLFYNDKINSVADKFRVAEIIAKELAHYWFGNYVTSEWWDELWLNEALAIYLQYKSVGSMNSEFDIDNQFIVDKVIPSMWDDGYATSRPIIMNVSVQSDLVKAFDEFMYNKGAAVIRMLESIVQENQLFIGLKNYLQKKPFGVVTSKDFYESFTLPAELSSISVKDLVEPWLVQKNYPEVAVLLENSNGQNRVKFIQDRFLLSEIDEDEQVGFKWNIYLQCRAGGQTSNGVDDDLAGSVLTFNHLLTATEDFYNLDRQYTWVKCNTDFKGYYITDYTNKLFEKFESILLKNRTVFSVGDRINLIHNAFELAFLGVKSYSIPNMFANYLTDIEEDVNPFRAFIWHINKVANIIEHRASFKNLKGYIGEMIRTIANRLGLDIWDDKGNDLLRLLKADLTEFQCRMQEEVCLNKATELFGSIPEEYFIFTQNNQNLNPVPGNYRPVVYKYHLQNTYDIFDWLRVFTFAELTNNAIEREISFDALGNSRQNFLLDLYLMQLLEDGTIIKIDDYTRVLDAVGQNPNGRYFAWYFVREYWYYLAFETTKPRAIAESIRQMTDSFDNLFLLEEILLFFSDVYAFQNADLIDKIYDIVLNNIFWVANKENDFENYFFGIQK